MGFCLHAPEVIRFLKYINHINLSSVPSLVTDYTGVAGYVVDTKNIFMYQKLGTKLIFLVSKRAIKMKFDPDPKKREENSVPGNQTSS